jgi:glutamyl-tRNA synthetase
VLVRSDGQPVFHLVNVVDDLEMGITHVIRGEDHLSNTAKHIALFRAFGAEPPRYAHIPLILNPDGSKMSKRDRGAVVTNYIEDGHAPEAVVNYLSLLGWSPADGQELLSAPELASRFDLDRVNRSPARFDEKKLAALHFEHTRRMDCGRFVALGREYLGKAGIDLSGQDAGYVAAALETAREKGLLFKELVGFVGFYFAPDDALEVSAEVQAKALGVEQRRNLGVLQAAYAGLGEFGAVALEAELKRVATGLGVKAGALTQPARAACTGGLVGPSLYHLMAVLGRERVSRRFSRWTTPIEGGVR